MSGEKALAEAIVARIKVTLPVVAAVIRSAIAASRLRKAYHDKTVLDGIDLDTAGRSGSEETVEMRGGHLPRRHHHPPLLSHYLNGP